MKLEKFLSIPKKSFKDKKEVVAKKLAMLALTFTTLSLSVGVSFAEGAVTDLTLSDLGTAGTTLQKIISLIFLFGKFGGFAMATFGVMQLVKFAQNHETAAPDALPKALGMLIGGIALFFAKAVLGAVGLSFD